ncbi:hypothetical protein LINPERHAP2_LOCUS4464 [Linum perenne]
MLLRRMEEMIFGTRRPMPSEIS